MSDSVAAATSTQLNATSSNNNPATTTQVVLDSTNLKTSGFFDHDGMYAVFPTEYYNNELEASDTNNNDNEGR